nr:immunoglobulin heavy chain junction region [Macaca mulatta]MOV50991.1 immunoglobulin heavy chain junction region [Macaca mulatta]MOV52137.1 immunoglobulin heavy chain junction region [Macaca mulatta]
CARRQVNLDYW